MKVTVVAQRYGAEILGGAESHARQVAERLAEFYSVDVLTSCALDYTTWANHYPPGDSVLNGVTVRRFPTRHPRPANIDDLWGRAYLHGHSLDDELAWLRAQGPYTPPLLDYLRRHRDDSDVFIFFTYLYYPTALGLRLVADKALLVPTAHDEGPLYLDTFFGLFHAPRAILYNTEEERRMVERRFRNTAIPNAVVGVGVDVPPDPQPARFTARYGLTRPYLLYLGRLVRDKGVDDLVAAYAAYRRVYPDEADLVLVGQGDLALPDTPGVVRAGFVDDATRFDALAGALAVVAPSRYESLSLIALEAWMLGKPVVTTTQSSVVSSLCRRAQGGLAYADAAEFSEIAHWLASTPATAHALGCQGQAFAQATYRWPTVIAQYRHFIEHVVHQPWQ